MKKLRLETLRTKISSRLRKLPGRINKLEAEKVKLLNQLTAVEAMIRQKKAPYVKEIA
jgi:hypothetical protein